MEIKAQAKEQTVEIHYISPRAINIGDVFYRIVHGDFNYFHEPCKVCGGTTQLTVNGITFECPRCNYEKETIRVCNYVVHRYRVFKIEMESDSSDWKASTLRDVKFSLYRKTGHGRLCGEYGQFCFYDRNISTYYNKPFNGILYGMEDCFYDDYKFAVETATQMTLYELERLRAYNAENGTMHEAVFTKTHDPR